jgi:hypothetical protein
MKTGSPSILEEVSFFQLVKTGRRFFFLSCDLLA